MAIGCLLHSPTLPGDLERRKKNPRRIADCSRSLESLLFFRPFSLFTCYPLRNVAQYPSSRLKWGRYRLVPKGLVVHGLVGTQVSAGHPQVSFDLSDHLVHRCIERVYDRRLGLRNGLLSLG
jgi:hypothetical protein